MIRDNFAIYFFSGNQLSQHQYIKDVKLIFLHLQLNAKI